MKIGIYARHLSGISGGVKEYAQSMISNLIHCLRDEDMLYIIHNSDEKHFTSKENKVEEIIIYSKNRLVCDFILAPSIINKLKLDVVWFIHNTIPFFIKSKKIVTIHDLAYYLPQHNAYKLPDSLYMRFMIKNSCKRADKIIAVSENTKRDIVQLLNIKEEKIKIIYEGVEDKFTKVTEEKKLKNIKEKYNLPDRFILNTGSITPRKNILNLIKAFNRISNDNKGIHLVLTGGIGWKNSKETDLINNHPRIKKTGHVDSQDMPALYSLAELLIYPSVYEGFGLPIIEAQSCGCPVISSNTSSLVEVGGDSVYYINPNNEKDISEAMLKVITSKELKEELIKKGNTNIKRFSWEKAANEVLQLCCEIQK